MTARLTTYFNADYCLIFLVEDDCLNLVSQFNVLTDNIGKRNFRMGEGLVGWTAQQGKPVLSYNVEEDRRYIMCIPNTKSQLTVPLSAYKKTVGVLVLGSHQSHYFEQKDFALVKAIASEIGLAVNDTRITEELKREKMQVSMLYETSRKIAASVGTEDVSNTGVKTVMDLLNATSCSLMLFDEENQQLYIVASRGLSKESEDLVKLKIGEGIAGRVFQEKYPILVEDAMTHHQFKVFPEQKEGFQSLFCVPLLLEDRCIGTLNVGTNAPFSKNQCELAEAVASQLSVALENAFLYESLEQMATHDKLTGLYNYGYFHEVLKKEMERAKRYNHHLSLALLDIDDFKKINDIYGHNVGNYLIKEVSHIIKKNLRSSDVLARYGGDELVVIMPETHSESAYSVMDRMKETIENHEFEIDCNTRVHQKKGGILLRTKIAKWFNNSDIHTNNDVISQLHITISVGVASISGDDISIKEFFNRVDAALRKAKRDGKNRISIWNEDEFE
jgi:diguanylate cyclase (GGDEF)-like protein